MKKLGLVLEGGASRTYFSIGVMDALLENNIMADYIIGASAGIANGVSYISKQKGRSLKIGLEYLNDKRYMGFKYFFAKNNHSYYNIKFVFDDIPNIYVPYDYDTAKKFKGESYAILTNLKTGKAEYFSVNYDDKTWKLLVATCSLPIMFKPVKINGNLYLDGGIADPIPIKKAYDDGCDKIIAVVTREKNYVKKVEAGINVSSFMYRKYPNFVNALKNRTDLYNKCHKSLEEYERENKALVIFPDDTSSWKRTESDPVKIKEMYDDGYKKAMEKMDEIKKYINS